jgi:hypothetical protein
MQNPTQLLICTATIIATAVTLLSERSAHAEVSLEELMHKCLQLENYWAVGSTQDNTGGIPKWTEAAE